MKQGRVARGQQAGHGVDVACNTQYMLCRLRQTTPLMLLDFLLASFISCQLMYCTSLTCSIGAEWAIIWQHDRT